MDDWKGFVTGLVRMAFRIQTTSITIYRSFEPERKQHYDQNLCVAQHFFLNSQLIKAFSHWW